MDKPVEFTGEIVKVESRKLASLDKEYKMVIISPDPMVNTLGLLDAGVLVKITVETVQI